MIDTVVCGTTRTTINTAQQYYCIGIVLYYRHIKSIFLRVQPNSVQVSMLSSREIQIPWLQATTNRDTTREQSPQQGKQRSTQK